MLDEILKESIGMIVGKQFNKIVDFLDDKKYLNEFLIAKKLEITINQTRNLLYRLSEHGLVSSVRKKDKKKGWYTYSWKLENLKVLEFLKASLQKRLEQIDNQIKSREKAVFYICEKCDLEFNEENALLKDFTCPECGNIFTVKDNTKLLREFKKNSLRIEEEIKKVQEEIDKEKEKIEKKKVSEMKKEAKVKAKVREEKRVQRKKERDILKGKTVKVKEPAKRNAKKKIVKAKKKSAKTKSVKKKRK